MKKGAILIELAPPKLHKISACLGVPLGAVLHLAGEVEACLHGVLLPAALTELAVPELVKLAISFKSCHFQFLSLAVFLTDHVS